VRAAEAAIRGDIMDLIEAVAVGDVGDEVDTNVGDEIVGVTIIDTGGNICGV